MIIFKTTIMIKKILFGIAFVALLASCSEDFKDWTEPQSNPQGTVVTFGNGTISPVAVIDFAEVTEDLVKVCDITAPTATDNIFTPEQCTIYLDGDPYEFGADGMMVASELKDHVVSLYGKAVEPRLITAQVEWVMSNGENDVTVMSEPFEFTVILAPLTVPELWYLVGSGFGNGSWNNHGMEDVGVSMSPMYGDPNALTILKWVGYLGSRRTFKIIHVPGESDQFSMVDGEIVRNNGDGSNIRITDAGYYEITLDTDKDEVTIEKLDIAPGIYSQIAMPGDYQGWDTTNNLMTPVNNRDENHDWIVKDFVVTENSLLKFAADGSWGVNWGGGTAFPVGIGTQGGDNITVSPGTYTVMFNDILGYYYFMEQ